MTAQPELAAALRAALDAAQFRVLQRRDAEEAESLFSPHLVAACFLDAEATGVQTVWAVERLRRRSATVPIVVLADGHRCECEEELYLRGVQHVISKPPGSRLVAALVERLTAPVPTAPPPPLPAQPAAVPPVPGNAIAPATGAGAPDALRALRDFSSILSHSLCAESLVKQFLLLLRELCGINRAAFFLPAPGSGSAGFRAVAALGLDSALAGHVELAADGGIAAHLRRHVRILRREQSEAAADPAIAREFEILGMRLAMPVLDREELIGVALFDERITGEPLANAELTAIFHLLGEVGRAVGNIRLHDQLAANHTMLGNVLRHLGSACIVTDAHLNVRHANRAAIRSFGHQGAIEAGDLPPALASKLLQVAETGAGIETFDFSPADHPETVFRVTIVPIPIEGAPGAGGVLLVAEDQSLARQLQRNQLDAAQLRLLKSAADRLAHEVGNALVPLATHQQLLPVKFKDADFRASLEGAMAESVSRITRLVNQMRYITRDSVPHAQAVPIAPLIEEAFKEARRYCTAKSAKLRYEAPAEKVVVSGDPAALRLALAEMLINALQANPDDARVNVRLESDTNGTGKLWARIEVEDNGSGFTVETARRAAEPFFTTRNVGLGLGLTVSQRIINAHHGKLEISATDPGQHGVVRVSLPVEAAASSN